MVDPAEKDFVPVQLETNVTNPMNKNFVVVCDDYVLVPISDVGVGDEPVSLDKKVLTCSGISAQINDRTVASSFWALPTAGNQAFETGACSKAVTNGLVIVTCPPRPRPPTRPRSPLPHPLRREARVL